MLHYLSSEANFQNGYHLADMLTKTCFVCGNKKIFEKFANGVQDLLYKQPEFETFNNVKRQVKDDLNKYSTRFRLYKLKSQPEINIKQTVYRSSTIFVSALATLYKISENSSFDIIDKLEQQNKISKNTANKLRYAIAIATEMRLRVYMKMKRQNDNAIELNEKNGIENFLNIVGAASTISYFQIAYCLQCEIAKQFNLTKLHFYSNPKLINIVLGLTFGLCELLNFLESPQSRSWQSRKFDFDVCISQLETQVNWNLLTTNPKSVPLDQFCSTTQQIQKIAHYLFKKRLFDEALEFFEQKLLFLQNIPLYTNTVARIAYKNANFAKTLSDIGCCHWHLHNYSDAITFFNRALEIRQKTTLDVEKDGRFAETLNSAGSCHIYLGNFSDALTFLNRALEIRQNISLNADEDDDIARTLHNLGFCHMPLSNYSDALSFFNRALAIQQNITLTADKDKELALTLSNIGYCHMHLCNDSNALVFFNRALEIEKQINSNVDQNVNIAGTFYYIGQYHESL